MPDDIRFFKSHDVFDGINFAAHVLVSTSLVVLRSEDTTTTDDNPPMVPAIHFLSDAN